MSILGSTTETRPRTPQPDSFVNDDLLPTGSHVNQHTVFVRDFTILRFHYSRSLPCSIPTLHNSDLVDSTSRGEHSSGLRLSAVIYLENGLTWNHQILHEPSYRSDPQTHWIWHHYQFPIKVKSVLSASNRKLSAFEKLLKWRFRHLQPRITKFGTYILTDVLNSRTAYD